MTHPVPVFLLLVSLSACVRNATGVPEPGVPGAVPLVLLWNATPVVLPDSVPGFGKIAPGTEVSISGDRRVLRVQPAQKVRSPELPADFRRVSPALLYGEFLLLRADDRVLIGYRRTANREVIVAFNRQAEEVTVQTQLPDNPDRGVFSALSGSRFSYDRSFLLVDIPPHGIIILYN
ncbi:MAG: alpha-glucosidase C-terminal domain-containing protein [Culturomica sp.]|nr:alpha-glucosidase C-terminal domain-containing protein [Culturomica sp.]